MAKVRTREDIIKLLKESHPKDFNILEIAEKLGIHRNTVGTYVKALIAEGEIIISRTIGRINMYSVP